MPKEKFIHEMRTSYQHKFAKKPEVIDGNMQALERAYEVVEEAVRKDNRISA
jgi:pyruvate ferredoxin oxidoreductase gamma subunit